MDELVFDCCVCSCCGDAYSLSKGHKCKRMFDSITVKHVESLPIKENDIFKILGLDQEKQHK